MGTRRSLVLAAVGGALAMGGLHLGWNALAAGPSKVEVEELKVDKIEVEEEAELEVPAPPEGIGATAKKSWESLEFDQSIPIEWGTVISINRVEEGGESYTFWFLGTDGTLRGVTTKEFSGPNRASFFPEVYVIRRR